MSTMRVLTLAETDLVAGGWNNYDNPTKVIDNPLEQIESFIDDVCGKYPGLHVSVTLNKGTDGSWNFSVLGADAEKKGADNGSVTLDLTCPDLPASPPASDESGSTGDSDKE
jgi:hypothetical protein